jgi:hypothetical protein
MTSLARALPRTVLFAFGCSSEPEPTGQLTVALVASGPSASWYRASHSGTFDFDFAPTP